MAGKDVQAPISFRAYSRHRGCSSESVRAAYDSGKIAKSVVLVNAVPRIRSVVEADAEWVSNTKPRRWHRNHNSIDWDTDGRLGTMSDGDLAILMKVTKAAVRHARVTRGIAPFNEPTTKSKYATREEAIEARRQSQQRNMRTVHGKELQSQRSKAWRLKHVYGLSVESHAELLRRYDGKCHICREHPATHIDHCHRTKVVRGILCHGCNAGIGYLRDSPQRLRRAAVYLEQPPLLPAAKVPVHADTA